MGHTDATRSPQRKPMPMAQAALEKRAHSEGAQLLIQLERMRTENRRLHGVIHDLSIALDIYIARAASTPVYGPVELTAGTCIGPGRRHGSSRERRSS